MRYTFTFTSQIFEKLTEHLFRDQSVEQAAYVLCGVSSTENETRLLAREVILVPGEELVRQEIDFLSIPSDSFMPVLRHAAETDQCFFLVHSHPNGFSGFSRADDREEPLLMKAAMNRLESKVHGSLVFSSPDSLAARVWLEADNDFKSEPISMIRIVGCQYRFLIPTNAPILSHAIPATLFERQVRAFGKDLQRLLGILHVGVVGCGGTGSAVIEQLIRLGVGTLTVMDHDEIQQTNVSRIHGSGLTDVGRKKTSVMEEQADHVGFGTIIRSIPEKVTQKKAAEALRECDLIFGCTDDHAGRSVLNALAIGYTIPLIDMGVLIDSQSGTIHSVTGRVTHVRPLTGCLICRGRIDPRKIAAEMMSADEYHSRVAEGYIPELGQADPSVITFTTAVASQAVMEMLHLLTGFMGDRAVSELLCRFDYTSFSDQSEKVSGSSCMCSDPKWISRGDYGPFLGIVWPTSDKESWSC